MEPADTRTLIMDTMQDLIQTRGFHAISYQDISDHLQIRKASIHYHFPSKLLLGTAVIERYRNAMNALMGRARAKTGSFWQALLEYFQPFVEFAGTPDKVCLCGALAGEFPSLPQEMQNEVDMYFGQHQDWVSGVLEDGRKSGEFRFTGAALPLARSIVSALQGALLLGRSQGNRNQINDVIETVRAWLVLDS